MPRGRGAAAYGRALPREHLDTALVEAARGAGAEIWQPWRARRYVPAGEHYVCHIERTPASASTQLEAPVVVAAHGSWDMGRIEAVVRRAPSSADLFAFKARFGGAALPPTCMPLVAFPGGYGGLVTGEGGAVGFSCCITRAALDRCRADTPGAGAGAAVLAHVSKTCRGMREALGDAARDGSWLAAGPMRPGFHARCADGVFAVGNAMAEAHPVIAEGISMAIQSGVLLCERLIAASPYCTDWRETARSYEAAYRRQFSARIAASRAFARLAMRPAAADAVTLLLERVPALLELGARWAGKASPPAVFGAGAAELGGSSVSSGPQCERIAADAAGSRRVSSGPPR